MPNQYQYQFHVFSIEEKFYWHEKKEVQIVRRIANPLKPEGRAKNRHQKV